MRILISTLIVIALTSSINAQSFDWIDGEETGYEMNPMMVLNTVSLAEDNSVWFAGIKEQTTNYYTMMGDNFLIRLDNEGNRLDEHLIAGSLVIHAMECDTDGNLYIAGDLIDEDVEFWEGTVLEWNENSINSFVARVSTQGTVDWVLNLNDEFGGYSPVSDMIYKNNTLYIAHSVWQDCFVSTSDALGNLSQIITETGVGILSGIDLDSQGNIYVSGSCSGEDATFNGVNYPSPFSYNRHLVKYDPAGVPQWIRFSEDVTCVHTQVKVDHDDNVYWAGVLDYPGYIDTIPLYGPSWVYDFFLAKLNPMGDALWVREVPETTAGDAAPGDLDFIRIMPDNSVTITGITRGAMDWGSGVTTDVGIGVYYSFITNYNSEGEAQWAKTGGGPYYTSAQCLDNDSNGNLFVAGVAHDTTWFDETWIYRETYYYPYIVKLETDISTGIFAGNSTRESISVYPNPVIDNVFIQIDAKEVHSIEIIDLNGRSVYQINSTNNADMSSLQPGIYFIRILRSDGSSQVEKLVKQ
jgi:hypothetical protein